VEGQRLSGGELLVVVLGSAGLVLAGVAWAGAALAARLSRAPFDASLADAFHALGGLAQRPGEPAAAWARGEHLPGPLLYWSATVAVSLVAAVVVALGIRLWRRSDVGTAMRRPLGVDSRARFARRRDLATIAVRRSKPGRFILGRAAGTLVASECRVDRTGVARLRRRHPRTGDRGAIALIGPSRSGKTTAVVSGILEWQGPAVLSSVKDDLLRVTAGWRARHGDIAVFDPTNTTSLGSAVWSPLRAAGTTLGAQRAARALCEAAPKGKNVEGGLDYWMAQAEMLISGLLFVAHHTGRDMGKVCEWVLKQDRPGEWGPGEVKASLDVLRTEAPRDVQDDADDAGRALLSIWEDEERTRSGVYSTARTVVWPWANAGLAASSRGDSIDLDWLLAGANTVYLCSPMEDRELFAPAFGGMLNDLIKQAYLKVSRTGRPLDPPLLVVVDEAGNTPMRALPEYASTLAGMGVLLVTVWQSLAQINALYDRQSGTILTNHLSKVFYAGVSDPDTKQYISALVGDDEVETLSRSADVSGGRASTQLSTTRLPLVPAHAPRQMLPGHGLLIHGTLPPAHIRSRPYHSHRRLRGRAAIPAPPPERHRREAEKETDHARAL